MKVKQVSLSEYKSVFIAEDGTAWAGGWLTGVGSKLLQYKGKFTVANGGLYNTLLLNESGDVYVNNPNTQDLTLLPFDSQGVPFKAVAVECQMQTYIAIRTDGTIWAQRYNSYRWFGTDSGKLVDKWTKIPGQPAVVFKEVVKGIQLVALTSDGMVYTLSDGSSSWVKKVLPGPAERILANGNGSYIAIIGGLPVGWGQSRYLTGVTGTISTYKELAADWGLSAPLLDIAMGDNATHFITSDGGLWGFGDNAQGEVGCGWELVNRKELYNGTQYVWNWINATQPSYQQIAFVQKPVQICTDRRFSRVFGGGTYCYYRFAIDTQGNLYSWGRNKAVVLANGMAISNEADYPNALDVLTPTVVDPFSYLIPMPQAFTPGSISAGNDQTTDKESLSLTGVVIPAGSKTFSRKIVKLEWRKLSGTTCIWSNPSDNPVQISGLTTGSYVFELRATDDNGATMTDTVMVSVEISNKPPVAEIECSKLVIDDSILIKWKATDPDGKIVATQWEKVAGPAGDNIIDIAQGITEISFSEPGEFTYRFQATDDKGATVSGVITLVAYITDRNEFIIVRKS